LPIASAAVSSRADLRDRVADRRRQHRHPQEQVGRRECLHHDHVREQPAVAAAVRRRHQQARPAALADLAPQSRVQIAVLERMQAHLAVQRREALRELLRLRA
jgi:hypothetical protein